MAAHDIAVRIAGELGVELPAAFVEPYSRLMSLQAQASKPTVRRDLAEVFAAAFDAGKDPFTDKAVTEARRPPEKLASLTPAIEKYAKRLLDVHAVDVMAAFDQAFTPAADTIARVAARTGPQDLAVALGARSVSADLREAADATAVIEKIRAVWRSFASNGVAGFYGLGSHAPLVVCEIDPDAWWRYRPDEARTSSGAFGRAWDFAGAGFPLRLASPTSFKAQRDAIEAARVEILTLLEVERRAASAGRPVRPSIRSVASGVTLVGRL